MQSASKSDAQASIAVLPFANMSRDADDEYFSDGLAEEIINALVKIPGLKVIARTSAFSFKGQNMDKRLVLSQPSNEWRGMSKKADLSGIGLHSLRHSHASALLHAGVPITNVAKRLGHRDAYTTAKIYAHSLPDTDQDTALIWDNLMSGKPRQPKPVPQPPMRMRV